MRYCLIITRTCLFVFMISLATFTVSAQLVHRDIVPQFSQPDLKASLVATADFKPFPQTPGGWKKVLPDSVISQVIARGEAALTKNFENIPATIMLEFVRNNNRTDYERLSFQKRNQLWDLVMAESMEGKGRFVDQIVNGIWSISEETFWGISAHVGIQKAGSGLPDVQDPIVDLFAAETGAVLAWTDYFVGPQLEKVSKLVRPRIRYEITRRILKPMVTAKYGWMGGGNENAKLNNWAPWIASNYIASNLLIEQDPEKRVQGLNIAVNIINQYINGLGEDGGCDEGPGYWTAAGGCVFDALNLLFDATNGKVNIYRDPFIQKMGAYIYKTHIAGEYFINVADAHPMLKPDGLMIYRFGKDMDYQPMMTFGSWAYHAFSADGIALENFHRTRTLYNLMAIKSCAAYPYKETFADQVWYSDVQLMASRSPKGMFVATHAGTNGESHNHNDVGDFSVYAGGYPVIIDVGSGTYTARTFSRDRYKLWFNTSAYHNLPTINGIEQKEGGQFSASDVNYVNNNSTAALSMDINGAYPQLAGVKKWHRVVAMNKSKGEIKVQDKYEMKNNLSSLTQSFMTVCPVDITIPGKVIFQLPADGHVYLDYDAKKWNVSKEEMQLTTPEDEGLKHSWEGRSIWRILLTDKLHKTKNTVSYSIHE